MALASYLTVNGIEGSVNAPPGREKMFQLISAEHTLLAGKDNGVHGGFKVVAELDGGVPMLAKACADGTAIPSATVKFFRLPRGGAEENNFTVAMTNVKITSFKIVQFNVRDPANQMVPDVAEVVFSYGAIRYDASFKRNNDTKHSSSSGAIEAKVFLADTLAAANDAVGAKAKQVGVDIAGALLEKGKDYGKAIAEGVKEGLKAAEPK